MPALPFKISKRRFQMQELETFSNAKTLFSNAKTLFSDSRTPFSNAKTLFSNAKTLPISFYSYANA
jgi:hypothetical protein